MLKTVKRALRIARKFARAAAGKDIVAKPDIACATERFGSEYGGWVVATDAIDEQSTVYSFGVGEDISFDLGLIKRFGLTVHAFDPTPRSIQWVAGQELPGKFVMHGYGLAGFDGQASFAPPENPQHVSHTLLDRPSTRAQTITLPVKRLNEIMKELGDSHIDLLKMNIEGAEYGVLEDLAREDLRPQQILVEFHHRFPGVGVQVTRKAIETLRSRGYSLFSVSATSAKFGFILP